MAEMLIRQLDDDIMAKLQRLARRHQRSTEEDVREILRSAVGGVDGVPSRLGSRIAARFSRVGLTEDIAELRGNPVRPAGFD